MYCFATILSLLNMILATKEDETENKKEGATTNNDSSLKLDSSSIYSSKEGSPFSKNSSIFERSSKSSKKLLGSPHSKNKSYISLDEFRMAAVQGNLSVVKSFVTEGVHVDQILKNGWTALMFSCSSAQPEIVLYLLQQEAVVDMHKEMFTSLMAACASSLKSESDLLLCVNHLLDFGAKADICERHRMTPLMFACKEGRESIVHRLLLEKIDVNKQDNKGWTALSWAASKGHGRIVRKLLEFSANPLTANAHGQTAIDIAMAAGYNEIANILEQNAIEENKIAPHSLLVSSSSVEAKASPPLSISTEIEMILAGLELSDLVPLFHTNKISLDIFLRLKEDDLVTIGVSALGSRKKLLKAIADIHKQEWKTSSLPNLLNMNYISVPEAFAMIQNINQHLRFIHASVGHLRDQIQNTPRMLEMGQEKYNVSSLADCLSDSHKYVSGLDEEVLFFKSYLDKIRENVEYGSADTITIKKRDESNWQRGAWISLAFTSILVTSVYFIKPNIFSSLFSLKYYPQPHVFLDIISK